jgi:lipopolysaccharide export system protein LptA
MGFKNKAIVFIIAALAAMNLSAQNNEQKDSLIRLIKAKQIELIEHEGRNSRRAIDATFMHNGTYLICDTAIWQVEEKVINAWSNVKVVQDETILTSERMIYLIDEDLVQCRGGVVQLEDSKHNTLRTHYLDYNTKDSLAYFTDGAAMRDSEGQIIESIEGSYDARAKVFSFRENVNMFTDSIFIKTSLLDYESTPNRANFLAPIDFWKDGNMLSALRGWYLRPEETFFFTDNVHGTTENQEVWSDSLYYYRTPNDVLMLGRAQVQDSTRSVAALANRIYYTDSLSQVKLSDQAAVALRTKRQIDVRDSAGAITGKREQTDTLYFGADTLIYRTIPRCLVPPADSSAAVSRLSEILTDPVMEYRRKAAKEAEEARARAEEEAAEREGRTGTPGTGKGRGTPPQSAKPESPAQETKPQDGLAEQPDETVPPNLPDEPQDSLERQPGLPIPPSEAQDSLTTLPDLEGETQDSLAKPSELPEKLQDASAEQPEEPEELQDSLAGAPVAIDTLATAPPDSTGIGFLDAKGDVRAYRQDIQIRCDSLRFNDLDSIARLYINPIVWNDGRRQYTSDSLFALVKSNNVDRVSLQGNAFIITQEDSLLFDQIKATEVMAYFDSTAALRRFDALGMATALFFLKEKEKIGTVNKVETKMISAWFKDGDIDRIFYFDAPKNDVYPLPQLKSPDRSLRGFEWQPGRRPKSRKDITTLELRPSERTAYARRPRTTFKQTDIYFPGYMQGVYKAIEEAKAHKRAGPPTSDPSAPTDLFAADSTGGRQSGLPAGMVADSTFVASAMDSLALADSVGVTDSLVIKDSLAADSAVAPDSKAIKKAQRDAARAAAKAAREARWEELDARDAAKAAEKQAKKDAKAKARLARQLERQRKQDISDQKKLEKYIKYYRRRKAREDARAAKKATKATVKTADKPASQSPKTAIYKAEELIDTTKLPEAVELAVPAETYNISPQNIETTKTDIQDGTDIKTLSPLHSGGHPERREVAEPTLDSQTTGSSQNPL